MNRALQRIAVLGLAGALSVAPFAQENTENESTRLPSSVSPISAITGQAAGTGAPTGNAGGTASTPAPAAPAAPTGPGEGFYTHPLQQDPQAIATSNETLRAKGAELQAQRQQSSMSSQTQQAWDRWSSGDYSKLPAADIDAAKKRDFLTLQRDWESVQVEAHKGNISPEANKKFLDAHSVDLQQRYKAAAEANGLEVKLQDPSGQPKVFSDVDIHGYPKGAGKNGWKPGQAGEMSAEQFKAARDAFNDKFNADLKDVGLATVNKVDAKGLPDSPSRRMRVDLMPITEDKQLFQQVEAHINPEGGVMYQCTNAVCQEVANRRTAPDGSNLGDATSSSTKADYLNEQYRQQRGHRRESEHLFEEAMAIKNNPNATPEDLARADQMIEMAQGEGSSLVGKYEERGNRTVDQQARNAGVEGVDGMDVNQRRQAAIEAVGNTRDHTVTRESADILATSENAIRNQQMEGARAMAADGKLSDAAEMGRNALDANTKGEILEAAREGAYARHQERLRQAHPDWDAADIEAAARAAANDDAARIAQEMRSQTPDVQTPEKHRWDINENPNRGIADADAMVNASGQGARDLAAVEEARAARQAANADAPSIGTQARQTVDAAGRLVDAAALGAQIGEAGVRQAGKAVDENRDLNAWDAGEAALEATGATGMYALGNRISREVLIEVQRGNIPPHMATDVIAARMVAEVGDAMLVDPVRRAIEEEWKAAEREGREPSYVSAGADAAVEIGGNVTGITQMADAIYEPGTWESRADAAAQADALQQYLGDEARWADKNISRLQRELEDLSLNGDLGDPATLAAIREREESLRAEYDRMGRVRDAANRNSDSLSAEALSEVNALARSQTNPEDMIDYVEQNVRERRGSGDELADEFAALGDDEAGSWEGDLRPDNTRFADAFAAADESSQSSEQAEVALSSTEREVGATDLSRVWAREDAQETAEELARVEGAARDQQTLADAWNSTLDNVERNATAQTQQGQQQLAAAQQQGQAAAAAAAAQGDPRMSASDFNDRVQQLDDEAEQLAQQQMDQMMGKGGANGPIDPNQGGQYGGAAIAQAARGDETGFDQRQASCNDVVKSGGNAPASVAISGAGFGGSATLTWDHYGVKDRIAVLSGGSVIFDSGCVPDEGSTSIAVGGQVKVIVEPNCEQTSSSQWEFKVACTAAVAQQ